MLPEQNFGLFLLKIAIQSFSFFLVIITLLHQKQKRGQFGYLQTALSFILTNLIMFVFDSANNIILKIGISFVLIIGQMTILYFLPTVRQKG